VPAEFNFRIRQHSGHRCNFCWLGSVANDPTETSAVGQNFKSRGRPHILLAEMTPGDGLRPTSSHTTKRGGFGSLSRSRPIGSDTADRHRASPRCRLSLARHSRREARRPFAGSKDHQRSTALLHRTHFLFRKGSRPAPLDCTDLGQPFSGHAEKWRLLHLGDRISVRFRLNCSRKFRNRGQRSVAKLLGRRECI
jgi:hypothetical protein